MVWVSEVGELVADEDGERCFFFFTAVSEKVVQASFSFYSKFLAQPPFYYFFGLQNFKQLFLTHFCTDSLDSLSKCVILMIAKVIIPLSKQYY